MFTLYHIPKRKEWGCTNNLINRLKTLSYNIQDVSDVIIESDINKAADLERKLNIEYGYGWNSSRDYRIITAKGLKGTNSKKAAITRKKNHIKSRIPIIAENIITNEIKYFNSLIEASKELNVFYTHISEILRGRRYSTKKWTFKKQENNI